MNVNRNHLSNHLSLRHLAAFGAVLGFLIVAPGPVAAGEHHDHGEEYAAASHRSRHHYDDDYRDRDRRWRHDERRYHRYDGYYEDRGDRRRGYGSRDRGRYYRDHGHGDYRFDVPRSIGRDHAHRYRSYHHSRIYDNRHRHYHEVYRFPYYGEYGVTYYPYAYCQGEFFARGVFGSRGPVFDLRIRF